MIVVSEQYDKMRLNRLLGSSLFNTRVRNHPLLSLSYKFLNVQKKKSKLHLVTLASDSLKMATLTVSKRLGKHLYFQSNLLSSQFVNCSFHLGKTTYIEEYQ